MSVDVQLERINQADSFESLWWGSLQNERENLRQAEQIILALRRRLRDFDPSLPDEYDGPAWWAAVESNTDSEPSS